MKRTPILLTAGALAALMTAGLLTGCGGSGKNGSSGDDNKLYVYNWGEYIDESVINDFEKETGIQVVYDVFETNEEMYPVIEAGGVSYDVVCPSDYMIQKMIENNLLAEINFDNIPNYKEIGQEYLDISKGFDPENKYSVPYCWGTMGILYNTQMIEELGVPAPTKWADLWDERLEGEILMQNSVRDAFTVALKSLGYSLNTQNPDELQQAKDELIRQKPLVQAYVIDQVRDKMIGGEAAVGAIYSVDSWVIPANAEHKENAEKWIDFLCRPDIAKKNFEYITYATPNKGAYELLDEELKQNKALFPDLSALTNCEIIQYPGEEADALYNELWKEVKAN